MAATCTGSGPPWGSAGLVGLSGFCSLASLTLSCCAHFHTSCPCRRLLGIQMHGQAGMQHLISVHFSWPALGQALLAAGQQGMLYFVFNSSVVAVLVAHDLGAGEFVAQVSG